MVMKFGRSAILSNFCREETRDEAKRSLCRRLCLSRLKIFKTHLLRVRRAKYWAHESGYSVCKKNTQSKTVGYKTLPISDVRVKSISYFRPQEVKLRTKSFGPELPPCDFYVWAKGLSNDFSTGLS